jgi:hypothetical protein
MGDDDQERKGKKDQTVSAVPQDFFTAKTFRSLGGSVVAAGVVATVISGVFGLDPKIVGFIASICVAYIGLFLTRRRKPVEYVVTGFNGCLIYFTLIGATSFYPYINKQTPAETTQAATNSASPFRPWVPDPNMVEVTRTLHEVNQTQATALENTKSNLNVLETKVQGLNISPVVKAEITASVMTNKHVIRAADTNIASRVASLRKFGIK